MRAFAIILIVAGLLAWVYGGYSYMSHRSVLDAGNVHIDVGTRRTVSFPPIVGVLGLVGGLLLLAASRRRAGIT